MRTVRFTLAIITSVLLLSIAAIPKAHAEQGYAWWEYAVSKSHVQIGEEFSVAVYVSGQDNTQYGKVTMAIEAWHPTDLNPKGYEFVRFEGSSDFPVDKGQTIKTGAYGYQCRSIERQAPADVSGRHLIGRYVYRALNPGTYGFSPSLPCNNKIESLTDNWGIVWDYSSSDVTVDKPAQPSQPTPSTSSAPTGSTAAPKQAASTQSVTATSQDATISSGPAVQGEQTNTTTQTAASVQSATKTEEPTAAHKPASKSWLLWLLVVVAVLPPAALKLRDLHKKHVAKK